MKSIFQLIIAFVLLATVGVSTTPVQAHLSTQTPFFKINGQNTPLYPVSSNYNTNITLPQDMGSENYLVNKELFFELDELNLPILPEIMDLVVFDWDLGDGTKSQGLKVNHSYTKPGSYIINISVIYGSEAPQLIQSTLVNILPDSNYQLPKAVIKVNGNQVENDPLQLIKLPFSQPIELDGTASQAFSSQIVSYKWDLDSSELPSTGVVKANYDDSFDRVYPVLQVTDASGFTSFAIVGLEKENQNFFKAIWFKISYWANSNQQTIELALVLFPLLLFSPILVLVGIKWLKDKKTKDK